MEKGLSFVLAALGDAVTRKADASSVFGQPFQVGDKTFLPVARVKYGLGGGQSEGSLGGGGGLEVLPLGLLEVGPEGVHFHGLPLAGEPEWAEVAPGIIRVRGCWLLFHGHQAALVNAPPDHSLPALVQEVASLHQAEVTHLFLTGTDYEVCGGLPDYRRAFPHARLVAHRAVEHSSPFPPLPAADDPESWRAHAPGEAHVDVSFDAGVWSGDLDGEPLFLLYAPRHSWTDHLVLFRGTLLGPAARPGAVGEEARARVTESLRETLDGSYRIHRALPDDGSLDDLFTRARRG